MKSLQALILGLAVCAGIQACAQDPVVRSGGSASGGTTASESTRPNSRATSQGAGMSGPSGSGGASPASPSGTAGVNGTSGTVVEGGGPGTAR